MALFVQVKEGASAVCWKDKREVYLLTNMNLPASGHFVNEDGKAPKPVCIKSYINPYPTAFPYGNGMVLHFYQQQESSTTKTVHRVINKGLKTYV